MKIILTDASDSDVIKLFSEYDDYVIDFLGDDKAYYMRYNLNENIEAVWIACCDDMPVGCAAFRRIAPDAGEVKRMFVKSEYRGQGISKSLLSMVINHAKEQKCSSVFLDTRITLEPAISLYRSFGFAEIYRAGLYVQMEMKLN